MMLMFIKKNKIKYKSDLAAEEIREDMGLCGVI